MKKFLLTMCVAFLSVIAFAQYNVIVELIDGTEVKYSAKNVKNIRIEKGDSTQTDEEVVDAATSDFTFFILNDKEAEVIGLNNFSATVIVPAKVQIKGKVYTVTSIGEEAFSTDENANFARITKFVLPNTITEIGEGAFYGCRSLTSIELGNSVTSIGSSAFAYCESLTSIEIPNSVTEIGEDAFINCESLTSIELGNSVTSIGEGAFSRCTSLTSIVIPNSVTTIGDYAFAYCESLTSIELGNSVTSIGSSAFAECSFTSIVIPNSVTTIGERAFYRCYRLTSIKIPNSVTTIGWSAFSGCTSLTSIVVDKDNKVYDSRENCNAIIETASNTLVVGCQNTVIPNSVTTIGWSAFSGCTSLTSIEIPESVTEIEGYAFSYCTSLTSIGIPNSVTTIGEHAFEECRSLTSIEIPNSVTKIGADAFKGCDNLKTARVPISLKSKIYSSTFPTTCEIEWYDPLTGKTIIVAEETGLLFNYDKTALFATVTGLANREAKETKIPSQVYYDGKLYDVTKISSRAFMGCISLTSIELGNSVTEIGENAFYGCTSLTSIVIPNSVTSIGDDAFYKCTSLTSIVVDKDNKVYDSRENCNAIIETVSNTLVAGCQNTVIPNSVTAIGSGAFAERTSLTSIEIPESVTEIGDYAFWGCTKLKTARVPKNCKYDSYYSFPNECTIIKY